MDRLITLLIRLVRLALIPITSGIQTIRWVSGVVFVVSGLTASVSTSGSAADCAEATSSHPAVAGFAACSRPSRR
ncbi:hypothetical protein [Nakamurella sp. PAMC28650]|uniref:hypothetical protein n=1 Tax=Nakamurella sp. PAMC28650 TaxID=2762325 RepID=UPI00164D3563|nr:hypothetical protein [Nakamurella sp. PAMC28650]QNK82878.1 hypothetical protein H7F38_09520 [Nakamurella sp. PAMC28650]